MCRERGSTAGHVNKVKGAGREGGGKETGRERKREVCQSRWRSQLVRRNLFFILSQQVRRNRETELERQSGKFKAHIK